MKTIISCLLGAAGVALAACGGGSQQNTTGAALDPAAYYNLVPGICAEYSNDAGTGPTIGVHFLTATNPAGIELHRLRHGLLDENDFVSFAPDGGGVLLNERGFPIGQELYSTPLAYLPQPPIPSQLPAFTSQSACSGIASCTSIDLSVSLNATRPYAGAYSDGGQTEYQFYFQYTSGDGGETLVESWLTPGIGFTDLYLASDNNGPFTDYLLVDIIPDTDGGLCAEH